MCGLTRPVEGTRRVPVVLEMSRVRLEWKRLEELKSGGVRWRDV